MNVPWDLIYTLIGVFLGFILAIVAERIVDASKTLSDRDEIKEEIEKELSLIKNDLSKVGTKTDSTEDETKTDSVGKVIELYVSPLSMSIWDGVLSSGKIQLLGQESYRYRFVSRIRKSLLKRDIGHPEKEWLRMVREIYDLVKDYNEWQNKRTDFILGHYVLYENNDEEVREESNELSNRYNLINGSIDAEIENIKNKLLKKLRDK